MRRTLLLSTLLACALSGCKSSVNYPYDAPFDGCFGNVESIRLSYYDDPEQMNDPAFEGYGYERYFEYDKDGNLIKSLAIADGQVYAILETEYNSDRIPTSKIDTISSVTVRATRKGNTITEFTMNPDGLESVATITFSDKKKTWDDGQSKTVYTYNSKHLPETIEFYSFDGSLESSHRYEYDKDYNTVKEELKVIGNERVVTYEYLEFDDKGNWTVQLCHDHAGKVDEWIKRTIKYRD